MRSLRLVGRALAAATLTATLAVFGCGGGESKPSPSPSTSKPAESKKTEGGSTKAASGEKTAVEGTGTATLKGKVTYDGDPPARQDLTKLMSEKQEPDKSVCLSGDTKDQMWIVGADKGVASVVVFLRAPEGKYLKADGSPSKEVTMDQPHCQFIPHVVAYNPSVYDAATKKQKPTGEKFKVLNTAPINHNTAWTGNSLFNQGKNEIIKSKGEMVIDAKPSRDTQAGGEDLLNISCDIHKWMTAKAAVFDHPYYAVTDANGNYEIKNAPAGAEVIVCVWHESMGNLKSAKTEPQTLKAGENTKDFKIK